MRALLLLSLALCLLSPCHAQLWDTSQYNRGLGVKQRGDLTVTLYGSRLFSHAFLEPGEAFFDRKIPANGRIEMIVEITETPGTVWDGNPGREAWAEGQPARIGLLHWRSWTGPAKRWYSLPRIEVRPGIHRLVVPVDPWAWITYHGKIANSTPDRRADFRESWTTWGQLVVVGGGAAHAHGITCPEGVGKIRVLSLRVRP